MFLVILWSAGLTLFSAHSIAMKSPEIIPPAQAIIVLTGGNGRIEEGLKLLAEKKAPYLFITGVHADVALQDIRQKWTGAETLPECCIELGYKAINTYENATETRDWLATHPDITSILLVTSDYHMTRALMEFHHALPKLNITTHAVKTGRSSTDEIYVHLLFREYHKTLYTFVRQIFIK